MKKSIALLCLSVFALIVSISFAWMGSGNKTVFDALDFQFGEGSDYQISIMPDAFDAKFYLRDEDGNYYEVATHNGSLIPFDNIAPADNIAFKVAFKNTSDLNVSLNMSLVDITSKFVDDQGKPLLCDVLYINLIGSTGYVDGFTLKPTTHFTQMSQLMSPSTSSEAPNSYTCSLGDRFVIPPTGDEYAIEVFFFISFAESAGNEYESLDLSIGGILITM